MVSDLFRLMHNRRKSFGFYDWARVAIQHDARIHSRRVALRAAAILMSAYTEPAPFTCFKLRGIWSSIKRAADDPSDCFRQP